VTEPGPRTAAHPGRASGLEPVLGFRDLVFFYVCAIFTIRMIPLAASLGPSVVVLWFVALGIFYVPQALTVTDLSTRFPGEAAIYLWSKEAFGEFHAFMTAWTYWASNLVFFPSVLIFVATQGAFVVPGTAHLAESSSFLTGLALSMIALLFLVNFLGLRVATVVHNVSGVARFLAVGFVVVLGVGSWLKLGSATDLSWRNWIPGLDTVKDLVFLSTFAYMFSGVESASNLGEEVKDARRNIPRAIAASGGLITGLYVLASLALLMSLTPDELTGLQGYAAAVTASATRVGGETFAVWATSLGSLLLIVVLVGLLSVWYAAAARLPFVIGLDRYLPPLFGRIHPRFGTPWVSLAALAGATSFFVVLAGMGGKADQVYTILVSLEIVIYFIPYLYMFAALLRLVKREGAPGALRVPGGAWGTIVVGSTGLLVTAATLVMALIPGEGVESHGAFYASVFGSLTGALLTGVGLYGLALWRRPAVLARRSRF
jgi:amino acid transporter